VVVSGSVLTPCLVAAAGDDTSGATGVVRRVVDGLLAMGDDPARLRAAVALLRERLAWCGPMWQVARAADSPDPCAALRSLRQRLDLDAARSVATVVRLLTQRGAAVRAVPGSALVAAVLSALPPLPGPAVVGLAGADAVGPDAVLNVAGTGDLARTVPTVIVATSVKLVPQRAFAALGGCGFETVQLNLFAAVVLDGALLTPAETGRRAAALALPA